MIRIEVCRQSHRPGHASQQRETALQLNAGVGNAWSQIIQCFVEAHQVYAWRSEKGAKAQAEEGSGDAKAEQDVPGAERRRSGGQEQASRAMLLSLMVGKAGRVVSGKRKGDQAGARARPRVKIATL